ncbi:hypothetical protein GXW82_06830 [Streptacidiphilus sp. 4-A2]|nr:hypothetical protein [Streptacidiphilus sp. 4-A2]
MCEQLTPEPKRLAARLAALFRAAEAGPDPEAGSCLHPAAAYRALLGPEGLAELDRLAD